MALCLQVCRRRQRIDPRADARPPYPQVGINPAQALDREESDWVNDISATGSTPRRRQHGGLNRENSL
jgi:hypothetical protein